MSVWWRCSRCGAKAHSATREELPAGWDWRLVSTSADRVPDRYEPRCARCLSREPRQA